MELEITKIKINKNNVRIYLSNSQNLQISNDAFTEKILYKGKKISEEEIKELKSIEKRIETFEFAYKLVSKKEYSSNELRSKLYKKGFSKANINAVIKKLIDDKVINDKDYMKELIETYESQNFGFHLIRHKLVEKGFSMKNISSMYNNKDYKKELKKAKESLKKFQMKEIEISTGLLKNRMYDFLLRKGFDDIISNDAISAIDFSKRDENRYMMNELNKCESKFKDDEDKIDYLLNRGYQFDKVMNLFKKE